MPIITGGGNVTVTVEVCFNQDPNDPAAPTAVWTDITQRCKALAWGRGRQYELDKNEAGTASFTVNNQDGALTPGNTASPYYPNVVLYRQIRIRAVYQSVTYSLYTGFVSRWPQAYSEAGQYATTTIEAVDAMGVLAQINLKGLPVDVVNLYAPLAAWPLDDPAFSATYGTSGPFGTGSLYQIGGVYNTLITPGVASDLPGFAGSTYTQFQNVGVEGPTGAVISLPQNILPTSGGWTMTMWVKPHNLSPGGEASLFVYMTTDYATTSSPSPTNIFMSSEGFTNKLTVAVYDAPSGLGAATLTPYVVNDGNWHLIALSLSSDRKTVRYAVDGNATGVAGTYASALTLSPLNIVQLGGWLTGGNPILCGLLPAGSGLSHFTVFPTDLLADVTNPVQTLLYPAGATAFAGETTDLRAQHIATVAGFGSRFTSTLGDSAMGPSATAGQTAADALGDVATTEMGSVFARGDGNIVFTPRHARYNPVPAFAFGEHELPYEALAFDFDPTHLVNQVTVTRTGGTTVTVVDAPSVKTHFTHTQTYTLQLNSDVPVADAANYLLSRYKSPALRVSSFDINPLGNSDLWPSALGLELGSCVSVARRPVGVPAITQTCFVDHLSHAVSFDEGSTSWVATLTLTPADLQSYMVWDASGTVGNWDNNGWSY